MQATRGGSSHSPKDEGSHMKRIGMSLTGFAALLATGCASVDKTVELGVGQTKHLTAYRADSCGASAPSYANVAARLPRAKTIRYSDGGCPAATASSAERGCPPAPSTPRASPPAMRRTAIRT